MSMSTFYVSPDGTGSGTNENNPALYTSSGFWADVQTKLSSETVIVRFLNGVYDAPLPLPKGTGNPSHRLILQGQSSHGAVFRVPDDDPPQDHLKCEDRKRQPARIVFENCRNIVLQRFLFTGKGTVGFVVSSAGTTQDICIEECTFEDMPGVYYGATGTSMPETHRITYTSCHFRAVGCDDHAHMMYHAYGSHHVKVLNCTFEDCAGDYVRFRDDVDHCVVSNCTFTSSGSYPKGAPASQPFIAMPLYNDCGPGHSCDCYPLFPDWDPFEYFATNYVITNNHFIYRHHPGKGERHAIVFRHSGFDPPGRNHLMTAEEGAILENENGPEAKAALKALMKNNYGIDVDKVEAYDSSYIRKALLKKNCGIDVDKVKVYDNSYIDVEKRVAFGSFAGYGATSKGWEGYVNIDDIINKDPVLDPPKWIEAFLTFSNSTGG